MIEVKLQTRISKQGKNKYKTYAVTIPKIIIEAIPDLAKTKKFEISLSNGKIIMSPKK